MRTRVQKWGNSLAVRIPRPFAEEAKLRDEAAVEMSVRNGKLIVAPVAEPGESLEELVRRITSRNRHREIEIGGPVGVEVW